jgi:hypothetical protein
VPDPFDTPEPARRSGPGPEFSARYDSECVNCDGAIYEGELIRADGDGFAHTECVDD